MRSENGIRRNAHIRAQFISVSARKSSNLTNRYRSSDNRLVTSQPALMRVAHLAAHQIASLPHFFCHERHTSRTSRVIIRKRASGNNSAKLVISVNFEGAFAPQTTISALEKHLRKTSSREIVCFSAISASKLWPRFSIP